MVTTKFIQPHSQGYQVYDIEKRKKSNIVETESRISRNIRQSARGKNLLVNKSYFGPLFIHIKRNKIT